MLKPKRKIEPTFLKEALPLEQCLAKSFQYENKVLAGRTVFEHCCIVGRVADEVARFYPEWIRKKWFPDGVNLLAASHDIGKVCPTFQAKIYHAISHMQQSFPALLADVNPDLEKGWGHAGVSQMAAADWELGEFIPRILGCHHGSMPSVSMLKVTDEIVGGAVWHERRAELYRKLKAAVNTALPLVRDALHAKVLAGLTTVSDWIGSGDLFENPEDDWCSCIQRAVRRAGFIKPSYKENLGFEEIFGFTPNATQQHLFSCCSGSGVYVLEVPMGLGKTEAALFIAYNMLVSGRATGLYFALPTQTTSNRIHDRVNAFLQKILLEGRQNSALLVHGNAWLKDTHMGEDALPGMAWFSQSKRGTLAPFSVGTIDQALMAVMNVRHGFVRTFGLLGKVVILDEVHSYDMYTGTILDELVRALRRLDCTVIILSATLTSQRRKALLGTTVKSQDYPLFSFAASGQDDSSSVETALPAPAERTINLVFPDSDDAALDEAITRARAGQQVLWIENTVSQAQQRYEYILQRLCDLPPVETGLIHSRFTRLDRDKNEAHWVNLLGKGGAGSRSRCGRILVGTQVLEQSLDIDADFLVTMICPSDMLLQRLGRLWRHSGTARPQTARPEAWILAPETDEAKAAPEEQFGGTQAVYAPYVLCRTLEVWRQKTAVTLPSEIRPIIEQTYTEREETGGMAQLKYTMENGDVVFGKKRLGSRALEQLALSGLSEMAPAANDRIVPTRYSESLTVEVLLLQSMRQTAEGMLIVLPDGQEVILETAKPDKAERREKAVALMRHCVVVPLYDAPDAEKTEALHWLAPYLYIAENEDERIRVALVSETGSIQGNKGLSYGRVGYRREKA